MLKVHENHVVKNKLLPYLTPFQNDYPKISEMLDFMFNCILNINFLFKKINNLIAHWYQLILWRVLEIY